MCQLNVHQKFSFSTFLNWNKRRLDIDKLSIFFQSFLIVRNLLYWNFLMDKKTDYLFPLVEYNLVYFGAKLRGPQQKHLPNLPNIDRHKAVILAELPYHN